MNIQSAFIRRPLWIAMALLGIVTAVWIREAGLAVSRMRVIGEVREAVTRAAVVGSTPNDVISNLKGLRFSHDSLSVDPFTPRHQTVYATLPSAKHTWHLSEWHLHVTVTFDSTLHARNVAVNWSERRPFF